MNKKLTAKQEKFARLVAEGKTQADAYREAYNSSRMKPETIQNNAYMLMQNSEISARVDKLKKEFTKTLDLASQITVERQLKFCQEAIEECLKAGDWANYYKGLDMQNKLIGIYAPTRTDLTTKGQSLTPLNTENLSTKERSILLQAIKPTDEQ
jgi:hypothetical protein